MKSWYAINTKANCEIFAKASLHHLGLEVFLPMLREMKTVDGKSRSCIAPLFPGYLFARCELPSQYRAVAYAAGVKRFVSFGSGPTIVDESVVQILRDQLQDEILEHSAREFSSGQVVRINDGPLCGMEAVFERHMCGSRRAVLLLKALSYHAKVILGTQLIANL